VHTAASHRRQNNREILLKNYLKHEHFGFGYGCSKQAIISASVLNSAVNHDKLVSVDFCVSALILPAAVKVSIIIFIGEFDRASIFHKSMIHISPFSLLYIHLYSPMNGRKNAKQYKNNAVTLTILKYFPPAPLSSPCISSSMAETGVFITRAILI